MQVLDFVNGSVTFTFRQQTVDINADNNGSFAAGVVSGSPPIRGPPDLAGATLTTLGLTVTGPGISIGIANGPRLTATGGTLALAIVTPASSAGDTRSWIALTSDIPSVSFTGFPGLDIHGSDIHVAINTAQGLYDPSGAAIEPVALNWASSVLDPAGDTPIAVDTGSGSISFTSELFDVQGTLGFDILGFVLAQGTLHVSRADVSITDPAVNGGAATGGTLLTISVSGGDAFIGSGASFSGSTIDHAGAVGFYLGSVSFDLALLKATTGESFVGLQATIGAADLEGIPNFDLHLRNASVEVSRASGSARLDWSSALTATDPSVTLPTFTMGSDVVDHVSGAAALAVAGVVAATTASFTLDHTVASGSDGNGVSFSDADVWALSLTGPAVFVGTGVGLASDGTALGYHVAPAADAVGISATASLFQLAEIVAGGTRYLGIEVDGLNGDLVGIDGATVHVVGVDALANSVTPAGVKLDWAGVGSVLPFSFAAGLTSDVSLHLSGALALSIAGIVAATTDQFTLDHTLAGGSDGASSDPITLSGADAWVLSLTGPSVFVGTGALLVSDGSSLGYHVDHAAGAVGIAASASGFTFAKVLQGATSYQALQVEGLNGDLVGITGVTVHVKGVTALANTVTPGTATKLNWAGLGSAIPVTFSSDLTRSVSLHLSGALALELTNVVAATADSFTLDHTTASGSDGNGITLTGADVWAFSLTSPAVFAGTGGGLNVDGAAPSGYDVSNGSLGIGATASSVKLAQITQGGTTYAGVEVDGLTGLLQGIPDVTVHLAGASALANSVSGGTTKLAWGSLDSGILPFAFDAGLTAGLSFRFAGSAAVDLANVLQATGTVGVEQSTASGSDNVSGSAISFTGADVTAVTLTDASVFVGTGGTLTLDGGAPSGYHVTQGSFGVMASVSGVKLARILDGATTYVGLEVDGLAGDLVGAGSLTLHLADGQALFNSVSPSGTKLGWATLDAGILPFTFSTDLTRDVVLHLSGAAALDLAGVVDATATSITADHTTASGDDGHGITLTDADVWSFTLTGASVFVGTGGSLATDGTALGYHVEHSAGAVGILASATDFKLARITQGATTYFGLEVSGLHGDLLGIDGATVHVNDVRALANSVDPAGTKLDWAGLSTGVLPFAFSSALTSAVTLHLSGGVALSIGGVVAATAAVFTLDHTTANGSDGNGITLADADAWSFSLTDPAVFVGTGAGLASDGTALGYHVAPAADAVGISAAATGFELAQVAQGGTSYLGVQVEGLDGDLLGIDGAVVHVKGVTALSNSASPSSAARLNWAGLTGVLPFDFSSSLTSDVSLHLSGALALAIADAVAATTSSFTLDHTTASGSDGHGITLTDADVWALTLTGPAVFVGTGAGLATDGTALGYHVAPTADAVGISASATTFQFAKIVNSGTSYQGIEIDGLNGDLVGIDGATVHVVGVDALVNTVSPAGTKLDWAGVGSVLPFAFAAGLTSDVSLHLSGALALSIAGIVAATTDQFTLDHTLANGSDGAATAPITLSGADAWVLSLTGPSVFVGTGATLVSDGSSLGYHVDHAAGAVGIAASASGFTFAKVVQGATSYQALQVEGLNGDLVGITGVTVHVKGVTALANTVTPGTATKLNWAGLGSAIPAGFSSALTRSVSLHLSGALALLFADVVAATADSFTLDHTTASGSDGNGITLTGADVWAFSLDEPGRVCGDGRRPERRRGGAVRLRRL